MKISIPTLSLLGLFSLASASAEEKVVIYRETAVKSEVCQSTPSASAILPSQTKTKATLVRYLVRQLPTLENGNLLRQGVITTWTVGKNKLFANGAPNTANLNNLILTDLTPTTFSYRTPGSFFNTQREVGGETTLVADGEDPIARSMSEFVSGITQVVFLPKSLLGLQIPATLTGAGAGWKITSKNLTTPVVYELKTLCQATWTKRLTLDTATTDAANSGPPISFNNPSIVEYTKGTVGYGAALVTGQLQRAGYQLAELP